MSALGSPHGRNSDATNRHPRTIIVQERLCNGPSSVRNGRTDVIDQSPHVIHLEDIIARRRLRLSRKLTCTVSHSDETSHLCGVFAILPRLPRCQIHMISLCAFRWTYNFLPFTQMPTSQSGSSRLLPILTPTESAAGEYAKTSNLDGQQFMVIWLAPSGSCRHKWGLSLPRRTKFWRRF